MGPKVPLTKEEKKAKKEAAKLEKLRQLEELKRKLKRDELKREMGFQAKRKSEVDKIWRETMMKIKEPMFKKDIEIMYHVFERIIDKKDHLVNHTLKLMDQADDQFRRSMGSFCDLIDAMINKFIQDLDNMDKDNTRRTNALLKKGQDDANEIMKDQDAAETHLQLMIFIGHTETEKLIWSRRGEFVVKEDEERVKYADIRESLRSDLETIYSSMWDGYKNVLKTYVTSTADNQKQVRRLRRKENIMADIIASQAKRLANGDKMLAHLRSELLAYESGSKQAGFRDRRDRHRAACALLKKKMLDGVARDISQLAKLVRTTDDTKDWLQSAHQKAEKILRLAALCRKHETRKEKVLPFDIHQPRAIEDNNEKTTPRKQASTDEHLVTSATNTSNALTKLWQRMERAEVIRQALLKEKQLLEMENDLMTQQIEDINDQVIGPKSLKCICGKKQPTIKKVPVGVEGCLELKKYSFGKYPSKY